MREKPAVYASPLKRSTGRAPNAMDVDEEVVSVREISGHADNDRMREVRISCPDATGLGCDITRMLLDFGLIITQGDISTDGKWVFFILKVELAAGVSPHWKLLKTRLEKVCPTTNNTHTLWRWHSNPKDFQHPFLLQVTSYDRRGVLHDLMHTLWESDVVVFKAHVTTGPSEKVLDMFWIYDNRCELPDNHRVLEISDRVRDCLQQQDAECSITPAPPETCDEDSTSTIIKRCACKDANPASPLRKIISSKKHLKGSGGAAAARAASAVTSESDEYGKQEEVLVAVDNCTTTAYSLVNIMCHDRKGLVYDLMRTMKDIQIRVAYGKITVREKGMCEVDLFIQEPDGTRINDMDLLDELVERIRGAVLLPVRISVKDVYDGTCTELLVSANLDSGGRGRPRVTYDVTAALNHMDLCVFMADVFIEARLGDTERRPQELHRFLIHYKDGRRLESVGEKRAVYNSVRAQLTGTQQAKRSMATSPQPQPPTQAVPLSLMQSLSAWKWQS
ncbi:hypothetical protein WJX72_010742 [[Myrmecia] bisecta]|uniref:ACT domain-containing protein n=1 Tax=[Myrmecia] bisecta TaxID=41462 RepID=A0AAW1P4L6_9CHLO